MKALSLSELDAKAREFISTNLGDLLTLGMNEAIVGHRVQYEQFGSQVSDGSRPATTSTVGAIVTYSRTVGGVEIVGAGSKIEVMIATDGTPWGFSYDWPTCATTATQQRVLPLTEIRKRHASLITIPANLASDVERTFECGYYDIGVRKAKGDLKERAHARRSRVGKTCSSLTRARSAASSMPLTALPTAVPSATVTARASSSSSNSAGMRAPAPN